ncbi:helix-turn-helix domain-containing protein [Streptacidiphilus sp. N1-12]|uniref:Helix-turn-helix domain-containing protein n=2 Tax=Streptacidiphilus alkalitolerans TaxID=3342712 RepID=A0ABV6W9B1_9ACTN
MTRWKALPAGLDPAVVQFIGVLRRLKDDSGLTHRRLAARTGYSASSWERYLGGKQLPPSGAVEALAALAGADPVRLLARHEAAVDAWRRSTYPVPPDQGQEREQESGSAEGTTADDGPDRSDPSGSAATAGGRKSVWTRVRSRAPRRRGPTPRLVLTAVVSAAIGATLSGLIVSSGQGKPTTLAVHPVAAHPVALVPSQIPYTCTFVRRDGLWYAGNSNTRTANVVVDNTGPEVAELQCLLERIHISPGGIDGDFGPLTSYAVIQAQKTLHLDVDGQVGPKTWAALRK